MVKRLFAVGTGVAMLGATAMGAFAATDLKDYPGMFVSEGKFNGLLVVGEKASPIDNLAMTDIAANMKYKKVADASTTTTTVSGDAWMAGTSSKKLEMANTNSTQTGENLYMMEQFIGKDELKALSEGTYSTTGTNSAYTQYLYFDIKNNAQNEIVIFGEDDNDVTADFFYVKSGLHLAEYVLEFGSSPESTVQDTAGAASATGTVLDDYENTKINFLGKEYTVVLARRPQSKGEDSIKLTLMGGAASGSLLESESTSVTVGDKSYDVALSYVDTTYAKFTVNGEQTDKLQVGDTFKLADGNEVGVSEILYQNYAGGVHSSDFFVGASKLELRDNDVTTLTSGSNVLKSGTETISGSDVNIEGTDDNSTFTLTKIRVNMTAQDDYYVPVNGKLSDVIKASGDDKELIFSNNWDIEYKGLTDEETHDIKLDTSTDRRYNLVFYDGDNKMAKMPFLYANSSTNLSAAEEATEKDVILAEPLNVTKNDYFVITGSSGTGTEKSYALQYKGADKVTATSPKIQFKSLGSGETLEYAVDTSASNPSSAVATIKLGGYSFVVTAANNKNNSDFDLRVDLDGDGALENYGTANGAIDVYDYYGMQMQFGMGLYQSANGTGDNGERTSVLNNTSPHQTLTTRNLQINWTTPDSNDYDNQLPAMISIVPAATTTNEVTISSLTIGGTSNPSKTPEGEENVGYGYTTMGGKWKYETPSGSPGMFTYSYPKVQRLPQVYVTSGAVTSSTGAAGDLTSVEVGVATKLDSEVADAWAQNLIVVGGPCVNTVASELMGSPASCAEGFTPGKAVVKLFEKNGKVAMLVAGYSGADTRLAGKVVAQQPSKLMGSEVEIEGTSLTDVKVGAPTVVAKTEEPAAAPAATQ